MTISPTPPASPDSPPNLSVPLPTSTYRLQLHAGFPFAAARRVLPYLARLGVSAVYLSPIWASTPRSAHGYDVTDHAAINPELGGLAGLRRFSARARELGLGVILDFVPNHMGIQGGHNPYWEDVLRHGQGSRYAHFFDISWQPLKRALEGKVLLPTLGEPYGQVLGRGELQLVWEDRAGEGQAGGVSFFLRYWERALPMSPRSVAGLLDWVQAALPPGTPGEARAELASVTRSVQNLPRSSDPLLSDVDRLSRAQELGVASRRLRALLEGEPLVRRTLAEVAGAVNADPARLDQLVSEQNYRLAWWQVAAEEINYRRFFDINDLAALRMEDPRVFAWAHSRLFELLREGLIQGVRLDHTDGLYDPAGYFRALQAGAAEALHAEPDERGRSLYVVAEKILEPGERLPEAWAIHGTTGYDFLAELGGVFVERRHADELSAIYRRFTGDRDDYLAHLYRGKQLIQRSSLPGEVNVLAEELERISESDLGARDLTLSALRGAIREVIACFPVYRTYVRSGGEREPGDDAKIAQAVRDAKAHNRRQGQPLPPSAFDYLLRVLTLASPDPAERAAHADFALKFQQLTGPVTAKGAEDTAFYRYSRLLSLNEVGSDPAHFGTSVREFHAAVARRAERWPHAMLASSTHDTKRGEDTRARISVLSEIPQVWADFLRGQTALLQGVQRSSDLGPVPTLHEFYGLLQNALGAYPLSGSLEGFAPRLSAYALKAAREAKLMTSWAAPDEDYEAALAGAVETLFQNADFLAQLGELHRRISPYGAQNGLSAALVKLTAPGVPDTYQGSESWNQSLVDPDNRRPVNYPRLERLLARLERDHGPALAGRLLAQYQDGGVKVMVTWAALQARRQQPELFGQGGYRPLEGGKHLLAFAREWEGQLAVTVAPRLTLTLTREKTPWALAERWGSRSLRLPPGRYRNALSGETLRVRGDSVPVAKVLEHFPLALLLREGSS